MRLFGQRACRRKQHSAGRHSLQQDSVKHAQRRDGRTTPSTLFPAPINTGNPAFNGLDTTKAITRQDVYNARLDHQFSVNDNVFARFTQFRQPVSGSGGFTGLLHDQVTDGYNVAVGYTHSFSSSTLLVLNFGRVSINIDQGSNYPSSPANFWQTVGFSPNFASNFIGGVSMNPEVVISGYIGNPNPERARRGAG